LSILVFTRGGFGHGAQENALPNDPVWRGRQLPRAFPDGDGICDLTARVSKDASVLRAAYAALGSQGSVYVLAHQATLHRK